MSGHHSHACSPEKLLIGAHTSAAGGVHHALIDGHRIGATTIQFFTANQRQWHSKLISDEEIIRWKKTLQEQPLQALMSHSSYLINLGSPNDELLTKSRHAFSMEIQRCIQLGLSFLNFHPGTATDGDTEGCIERIIQSLLSMEKECSKGSLRLLIETTAGQGSVVGHRFEQIAQLVHPLTSHLPIGVCIDTCHIFAAGYDISSKKGWDKTLEHFDQIVGLQHLYAIHVNDSKHPLGSKKDRHASLGEGCIGMDSFKAMMQNPHLVHLPKYLETPDPSRWADEIQQLRNFAKGA